MDWYKNLEFGFRILIFYIIITIFFFSILIFSYIFVLYYEIELRRSGELLRCSNCQEIFGYTKLAIIGMAFLFLGNTVKWLMVLRGIINNRMNAIINVSLFIFIEMFSSIILMVFIVNFGYLLKLEFGALDGKLEIRNAWQDPVYWGIAVALLASVGSDNTLRSLAKRFRLSKK